MLKRGGLRLLTLGEIRLATELYGHNIRYNRVWIHHGSYFPFNMQGKSIAVTPNGEMWFEVNVYKDDYSLSPVRYKYIFLHEMMHVWQYQRGMNVRMRGMVSWAVKYNYDLSKNSLKEYSMEQQASIVADYWLLVNFGFEKYSDIVRFKGSGIKEVPVNLIDRYKQIIGSFPK